MTQDANRSAGELAQARDGSTPLEGGERPRGDCPSDGARVGGLPRGVLVGLVACWLGAAGVSWGRWALTGTMRIDDVAPAWAGSLLPQFVLGLMAALGALLYGKLCAAVGTTATASRALLPSRVERPLLWAALATSVVASLSLPLTSNDLFSNLAYGRLTMLGQNPYRATPQWLPVDDPFGTLVGSRWRGTPTVYGPILAAVNGLAGRAGSVPGAMLLFKALASMAVLASIVIAHRVCRAPSMSARSRHAFVVYAFSPVLVWELSAQSHNDAFMVLAMAAFAWAVVREREWLAMFCLAIAFYTKVAVAPLLAFYIVSIARKNASRAVLMGIAVLAIGVLLFLPYWEGLDTLRGPSATMGGNMSRTARSFGDLACLVAAWFGESAQRTTYRLVWLGGLIVLVGLFVRGLRQVRTAQDAVHHTLVMLGAYCLFASPWFQPWYVTWLLPLTLLHHDERWRNAVALYGALTPVQYIVPLDPLTTIGIDLVVLARVRRLTSLVPQLAHPSPRADLECPERMTASGTGQLVSNDGEQANKNR